MAKLNPYWHSFWPCWMPPPQASFSFQPEDTRTATDWESGSRIRREFGTDVLLADCTVVLNRMQACWFEAFERAATAQGLWIEIPLWYGGRIRRARCLLRERPKLEVSGFTSTYSFGLLVTARDLDTPGCVVDLLELWSPAEAVRAAAEAVKAGEALRGCTVIPWA